MNIWGFVIGGAIGLFILIIIVSVAIENCLEQHMTTMSQYIEKHNRLYIELKKIL